MNMNTSQKTILLLCLVLTFAILGLIGAYQESLEAAPSNAIVNGRDPDTVLLESIDAETDGIATSTTLILAETIEIEKHFHNVERWLGAGASSVTMTAYTCTPGSDAFGAWGALLTSVSTPVIAGKTKYDLHKVEVTDVAAAELTRVQFGWSTTSTSGGIVAAGTFTEFVFFPTGIGANVSTTPIQIMMPRLAAGTRLWSRCWVDGENATAIKFLIGIHEYDE